MRIHPRSINTVQKDITNSKPRVLQIAILVSIDLANLL
jgi:hypothetical protein